MLFVIFFSSIRHMRTVKDTVPLVFVLPVVQFTNVTTTLSDFTDSQNLASTVKTVTHTLVQTSPASPMFLKQGSQ